MKYIIALLLLIPAILFAQEERASKKEKRLSFLVGTSQGISLMRKEAQSNTTKKTFKTTTGYASSYFGGISIRSKSKKAFGEIRVNYHSYSNGIKRIIDVNSASGYSSKTSRDRFNYLGLSYLYSRYVKTIKDFNTFFSVGIEASYILNEKKKLRYENSSKVIKIKGKNFSANIVALTTPTFLFSYGVEFEKGVLNIGSRSRLSIDLTYDTFIIGLGSSPSNQYFSTMINYRLLF